MSTPFTAEILPRLKTLLAQFQRSASPSPSGYHWSHHHDGGQHRGHVVFGCMVHGNEHGSLPAAVRLVEALASGELKFGGRVTVFLGNPEAALENARYLETDLNRVFLDTGHSRHEDRRAQEIMPILNAADVFIDFHQTILETTRPFYIFPWHTSGWHWARAIRGSDVWVTRDPGIVFSSGSKCTDEYVADRGRPGITLELSQKGFSDAAEALCLTTMRDTLRIADEAWGGTEVRALAERQPELSFFQATFAQRFETPELALKPGLVNFQSVRKGERLEATDTPNITVPADGMLLFPKYPKRAGTKAVAPWPNEIYRLVTPMEGHPAQLWEV
jgi:succinylglutamate desuccinylase